MTTTPPPAASKKPAVKPRQPRRRIPWVKICFALWGLSWLCWAGWRARTDSRQIMIPDNVTPEVSLPTVDAKALDEIRSRDSSGLIVPSQNNSPRANPFE